MSGPTPPPPSPPPEGGGPNSSCEPVLAESTKKKSRLQWDEDNLISNAQEMERAGPRMKIDEPKTPYVGSETGSSTSGSAHQSPPESPHFLPGDQLHGFRTLEENIRTGGRGSGASSDGASSAGSGGRSVHIDEGAFSSGGSSPRSKELFAARRKAHYRNEALMGKAFLVADSLDEEDEEEKEDADDERNNEGTNGHAAQPNGVVSEADATNELGARNATRSRLARLNGHLENGNAADDTIRGNGHEENADPTDE